MSVRTFHSSIQASRGRRSLLSGAVALITAVSLPGCRSETQVPVYPVSGKVSFKGAAANGAQVVLHPVGAASAKDVTPIAHVKEDGTFRVTSYKAEDGAPAGEYVATIEWFKVDDSGGRGPNVLPPQYASPASSPVKISVASVATEIPPINVQ